ncbi:AMP-binding protein [Pseudonocardia nematodicida]|uniref:AMP-binding protein n=1 Tax=Pseudonocardia nematodicida TaxID=1206997 RepID=A0ABV1KBG8_9PSEU
MTRAAPDAGRPLIGDAARAAETLRAAGAGAGHRVLLDAPASDRWSVWPFLLAARELGAASLVADPGWSVRDREAVLADAAPDVVVRPSEVTVAAGTGADHGVFLLATTSGSTGTPSVLARTAESWRIGFETLGPLPGPVLVPGPPSSTLYLFGALHALHHGLDPVLRDRFDPAEVPDGGAVHLVPAQLSALLDHHDHHSGAPAPRVVVCGGAHVGAAVRERCARLLPGAELVEYYGSAEHSLIAIRRGGGALRPVPGVEVTVRDGVLWVDSPQAVLGRLRGGVLERATPGPTTVGDRGELAGDGSLSVLGRAGATITSGGTQVAAEEVEQVLRAVPGVADVVVAGMPHPSLGSLVTAVVEAGDGTALRDLRAAARDGLAPAKRPRRWLRTTALPRLGSGKPARARVDAGLRDGTLDARPFDVRPLGAGRTPARPDPPDPGAPEHGTSEHGTSDRSADR